MVLAAIPYVERRRKSWLPFLTAKSVLDLPGTNDRFPSSGIRPPEGRRTKVVAFVIIKHYIYESNHLRRARCPLQFPASPAI